MRSPRAVCRRPADHGAGHRPAVLLLAGCVLGCAPALGQELMPPGLRPGETRPELPEYAPPPGVAPPGGGLQVPPVPAAPAPSPGLPPIRRGPAILLKGFRFVGNTVFSDDELSAVVQDYVGRPITAEDLEEARNRLTQYYVAQGYLNSGALLPDQTITAAERTVTFQIIEGALTEIVIHGEQGLNPAYLRHRLELGTGPPLNLNDLQQQFQLLLQDPLIEQLNGRLSPGVRPGEAVLDVDVVRTVPYELMLSFDNHTPPSIGEGTGRVGATIRDLTGWGDSVTLGYSHSSGYTELDAGAALPITARDTTLHLSGRVGTESIVEAPLSQLDINDRFWDADLGIRHPLYRTPQQELALDLTFARRHSETTLLGRPFSFSLGATEGTGDVSVLRFAQSWTDRSPDQVIAARSTLNFGLGILGATRNANGPDSRFFSWLGQAQLAHQFSEGGPEILLRIDLQLASSSLLSLEQFPVGGANSVRGYRENTFVADNGLVASVEGRVPLFDLSLPWVPAGYRGTVFLAPFFDYGNAWQYSQTYGQGQDLYSLGVGLRWAPAPWLEGALYYGYGLRDLPLQGKGNALQDKGVHLSLTLRPPLPRW